MVKKSDAVATNAKIVATPSAFCDPRLLTISRERKYISNRLNVIANVVATKPITNV